MRKLISTLTLAFGLALPVYGCADDINAKGDVDVDQEDDMPGNSGMAGGGAQEDDGETSCAAACDDDECVAACNED